MPISDNESPASEGSSPQESDAEVRIELVDENNNNRQDFSSEHEKDGQSPSIGRHHAISTAALCLCTLIHSYLLISVFPYAGYMVVDLIPAVNEESAGTYAGLIASSFMAGRTLSSYHWGKVADVYGRVFVLNASLVLSSIFTVLFGTAKTFGYAMWWRFLLGVSNGIISISKTAASELAYGDERLERRAMGLVMGMRGWAFLVSPAIGGLLAEPLAQYPNATWLQDNQWVRSLLSQYPFLLPNLVGAVICLLTAATLTCFLEETLPQNKLRSPKLILPDLYRYFYRTVLHCRLSMKPSATVQSISNGESQPLLSQSTSIGDADDRHSISFEADSTITSGNAKSVWSRKNTRRHLMAYWMFSFVVVALDEAFPLFCISRQGGLGLSEGSIGKILSSAGLIFALCQYAVFSTIVHRCGLYPSITIGCAVGIPPVFFIPLSLLLNQDVVETGALSWATYTFLSMLMAVSKIFSCLFFTSIAIASNNTVPSSQRGTMNGLNMLGGSIAKGLGPTFAGALVAFSVSSGVVPSQYGSIVIFSVIATLGLVVVGEVFGLESGAGKQDENEETS